MFCRKLVYLSLKINLQGTMPLLPTWPPHKLMWCHGHFLLHHTFHPVRCIAWWIMKHRVHIYSPSASFVIQKEMPKGLRTCMNPSIYPTIPLWSMLFTDFMASIVSMLASNKFDFEVPVDQTLNLALPEPASSLVRTLPRPRIKWNNVERGRMPNHPTSIPWMQKILWSQVWKYWPLSSTTVKNHSRLPTRTARRVQWWALQIPVLWHWFVCMIASSTWSTSLWQAKNNIMLWPSWWLCSMACHPGGKLVCCMISHVNCTVVH